MSEQTIRAIIENQKNMLANLALQVKNLTKQVELQGRIIKRLEAYTPVPDGVRPLGLWAD